MVILRRTKPDKLVKLEALLERLPDFHSEYPRIQEDFRKRRAGYRGELSINYPLSLLPKDKYLIFHGLRLPDQAGSFFEIDTLLLSSTVIYVLSIKNYRDEIYINDRQLIQQQSNGKKKAYEHPNTQVQRHIFLLKKWLQRKGFSIAPPRSICHLQ